MYPKFTKPTDYGKRKPSKKKKTMAKGGPAKSGTEALLNALDVYDVNADPRVRRDQYNTDLSNSRESLQTERERVQDVRSKVIPMSKKLAAIHKRIKDAKPGFFTDSDDKEGQKAFESFQRMLNPKGDTVAEKKAYLRNEIKNAPKLLKDALPDRGAYNLFLANSDKYAPDDELYCTPYGCFAYQKAGAKDMPTVGGNFGLVGGVNSGRYPFEQVSYENAEPGDLALAVDYTANDYRDVMAGMSMRPHHTTVLDTKYSPTEIDAYQVDNGERLNFQKDNLDAERFDFYRYTGQVPGMEAGINYQQQAVNALNQAGAFDSTNMESMQSIQPTAVSNPALQNRTVMPMARTSYASFAMGGPTNPNELNMATVGDPPKPAEGDPTSPMNLSLTDKDKNLIQNSIKKASPGIGDYQIKAIYDNFFADEDSIPYTLNMLNSGKLEETVQLVLGSRLASKALSGEKPGFGDIVSTLSGAKGDMKTALINMGIPPEKAVEYLKAQARQAGAPEENLGYIDRLAGKGWANPLNFFDYELPADRPMTYASFAAGGDIPARGGSQNMLTNIENGGTHEENPLGGVPMGQDSEGNQILVEEGETVRKESEEGTDFVYSDRIRLTKQIAKEFNIPMKYVGKTFAEISKQVEKRSPRKNDPIDIQTKQRELDRLEDAQEAYKESKLSQAQEKYGSPKEEMPAQEMAPQGPSPEEAAMMQQMMAAQGQMPPGQGGMPPEMQGMPPQGPPMMGYGGYRSYAPGGPSMRDIRQQRRQDRRDTRGLTEMSSLPPTVPTNDMGAILRDTQYNLPSTGVRDYSNPPAAEQMPETPANTEELMAMNMLPEVEIPAEPSLTPEQIAGREAEQSYRFNPVGNPILDYFEDLITVPPRETWTPEDNQQSTEVSGQPFGLQPGGFGQGKLPEISGGQGSFNMKTAEEKTKEKPKEKEYNPYVPSTALQLARMSPVASNLLAAALMPPNFNAADYMLSPDDTIIKKPNIDPMLQDINRMSSMGMNAIRNRAGSQGEAMAMMANVKSMGMAEVGKARALQYNQWIQELDKQQARNLEIAAKNSDMKQSVDAANAELRKQKLGLMNSAFTEASKVADGIIKENMGRDDLNRMLEMYPYLKNIMIKTDTKTGG